MTQDNAKQWKRMFVMAEFVHHFNHGVECTCDKDWHKPRAEENASGCGCIGPCMGHEVNPPAPKAETQESAIPRELKDLKVDGWGDKHPLRESTPPAPASPQEKVCWPEMNTHYYPHSKNCPVRQYSVYDSTTGELKVPPASPTPSLFIALNRIASKFPRESEEHWAIETVLLDYREKALQPTPSVAQEPTPRMITADDVIAILNGNETFWIEFTPKNGSMTSSDYIGKLSAMFDELAQRINERLGL